MYSFSIIKISTIMLDIHKVNDVTSYVKYSPGRVPAFNLCNFDLKMIKVLRCFIYQFNSSNEWYQTCYTCNDFESLNYPPRIVCWCGKSEFQSCGGFKSSGVKIHLKIKNMYILQNTFYSTHDSHTNLQSKSYNILTMLSG